MAPIKQLIEEPFGPYPDHIILSSSGIPQGKNLPRLRRLRLRQNNKIIGLDTCEHLVPPTKSSNPVSCFGVLVIESLAWLSDTGRILLAKELNKRDENWAGARSKQNSKSAAPNQALTLEGVYGKKPARGSKISVWINFEKESPASFMAADDHPESLLLSSKAGHRFYEIVYRLVALIKEIVDKYKLPEKTAEVENFVNGYLLIHKEKAWSHATIFAEENEEQPVKPRLRHISHAEVREGFAAHSGWLLAFYLLSPKCPIDVGRWCEFIAKVRIAKKAPKSGTWSQTYEDDEIWASDDEGSPSSIAKTLAKFGGPAEGWEKKLRRAITRQASPPWSSQGNALTNNTRRAALTYDPDFSEPSTPGCSDSEDDSAPPQIFHPILLHMARPPTLRPGRFIWDCPVPKCEFSLNLLEFKQTGRDEGVPEAVVRNRQFENFQDEQLQTFLYQRVSDHYTVDHLGISVKPYEDKQKFKAEFMKKKMVLTRL
ncbi:hypothetical protein MSAN_01037200 [Mycena sanguinolenta]|uniref:Uncharacterized protein n=1 Tax=Mycena sanguinolenta TaxID=230812 RepID=A0A8H7D9G9_9AGAR|nr:hypothetical protein MSAN_01037200 [Mycena sanguinolenta]